jgi:protein-disulfide isomerase
LLEGGWVPRVSHHGLLKNKLRWYVFNGSEKNPMEICELLRFSKFRSWRARMAFCGLLLALTFHGTSFPADSSKNEPLADVNGETITAEELERALGARLSKLEEQIYDLKSRELDSLIAQRLFAQEAAKRGISVPALLDAEVTAKVSLVTEKEIEDFYQANKARMRGDDTEVRQKIRAFLQQQKLTARREAFVESLRSQGKVVVRLQPPPAIRIEVSTDGAPIRGAADAPVTVVEFSDFECPFCKQTHPTLKQLLDRYPGKVRLAYRDFPLDSIHPQARRAAEAARCANDQGKFWEYHDVLFSQSPQLAPEDLRRYAGQMGLDVTKFDGCLATGVHRAAVQRDLDEGNRLGITGTPAFFINGRTLTGAQPLEAFTRLIEQEMARVAASGKSKK